MAIKLLTPYGKYPHGAVVQLDAATEAGMVAAKLATLTTAGGALWVEPQAPGPRLPGITLSQSAIPVILAPSGTVATNGVITLGTALPAVYPSAWVYLPAGAVLNGQAGLYYATFSSTTVGVVSNLFVGGTFNPHIPTVFRTATGSNAAYTQTTGADIVLAGAVLTANLMGANGSLRVTGLATWNNSAGAKTYKVNMGTAVLATAARTTTTGDYLECITYNRGPTAQVRPGTMSPGPAITIATSAIDTTADVPLTFTAQLAVATDYVVLEALTFEVLPA